MKTPVNTERRKLFTRLGFGALSAGLMSLLPFRNLAAAPAKQQKSEQHISISIDPMAVKRTKKG